LKRAQFEFALALACLAVIGAASTALVYRWGWTLYYGDAEAHLNIARRIIDSRTPGYDQIGTVWLPLPHILTLALVWNNRLWQSGLAGAIPSSVCFVLAGVFLFAAMRRATHSSAAAFAALGLFALNPNLLYLQATPMTEPMAFAGLMALLYFTVLFRETQSWGAVIGAGLASLATTLARYEGWFLIPFVMVYFVIAARGRRFPTALVFLAIASLGPIYWLGHNFWLYSNPLEFYNGPYSAKAIYERGLALNTQRFPGDHDWRKTWLFFRTAARLCAGWGVVIVAAAGLAGVLMKRVFWPVLFASLAPIFYLWSMHSGATPILLPKLWFNSYYNSRYGLAALPLLAIAGGCLTLIFPPRFRAHAATVIVFAGISAWLSRPTPENWICWKESQVNAEARQVWTRQAAQVLESQYRGGGIFTSFGDLIGIFREAGIPLRGALHEGNVVAWMTAVQRPGFFLHEKWAVGFADGEVVAAVRKATFEHGPRYRLVRSIAVPGAPVVEIYERE
jgi:hypothetical protein